MASASISIFDGVHNGCRAAAKGTRMDKEIIEKDSGAEERYKPITDAKQDMNRGRRVWIASMK